MNKSDRMLAIVLELQRGKVQRAEDLALLFETSVRTIYRDIQALCEAGVPVVGEPGVGYSLMEGYFLPPISFTAEEAVTLLIGLDFVEQRFDNYYKSTSFTSRSKIEAILPVPLREEVGQIQQGIRLLRSPDSDTHEREIEHMGIIRKAMQHKLKIRFHYHKPGTVNETVQKTVRMSSPYGMLWMQGSWMLIARCDLRQEIRHFRISRMSDLEISTDPFDLPPGFNIHSYSPPDNRDVHVRVWFHGRIADRVIEANNYYMEKAELQTDGLYADFRVRHPEDVLHWILGWGASALVLEPESLRIRIREEASNLLKHY
ncbi:YafY family protein [Paenibacillus marchantiae]|uniref:helix-turn-helix transcriptional regulator n=1 Tax=Paenibacillus TaxID=44249 RepID=UPI0008866547|nr:MULTISPECIES: YafY family protein [Paenibacillus]WDQ30922.1 YafY family protein [Paenibacillus marchantiae]SDK23322.1 Predicted DNA-binding transcriptional regulator YafY, contains an HTH and WYL domains [Paenibacillus sp. OK060]